LEAGVCVNCLPHGGAKVGAVKLNEQRSVIADLLHDHYRSGPVNTAIVRNKVVVVCDQIVVHGGRCDVFKCDLDGIGYVATLCARDHSPGTRPDRRPRAEARSAEPERQGRRGCPRGSLVRALPPMFSLRGPVFPRSASCLPLTAACPVARVSADLGSAPE
jgi:hypothetical protein